VASPYRTGRAAAPAAEGREDGLVDALIQQFADPLAFYRELVQNAIDAGASRIAITAGWEAGDDPEAGTMVVSLRDDGCGMGRDILENQLTVLFRSGKEGQEGKIGKFGIGFVSVLALEPEKVVVRTTRGDGELWTLELRSDQSYDLFHAAGAGASGTTVSLHVPLAQDEIERFVEGSERALRKWCRHAEIPIQLVAHRVGEGEPLREARIDTPLSVEGLVTVRVEDGGTTVVAGVAEEAAARLAFFNRGLLLHETTQPILGMVRVSIQDARLEHTLSRDNVRRDAHYDRVMRLARRAIDRDLTRAMHDALEEGAIAADAVLRAALGAGLALDPKKVALPLMHGRRETLHRLTKADVVYVATSPTPLTEAASEAGLPVLDLSAARAPAHYLPMLAQLLGAAPRYAENTLVLASPVSPSESDLLLLDRAAALLAELHRAPSDLRFVVRAGALEGALCLAGEREPPRVLTEEAATEDVFPLLGRPPIWLDVGHPVVRAARAAAVERPSFAAAVLARAVLLDRGLLDEDRDDEWLEEAAALAAEGP